MVTPELMKAISAAFNSRELRPDRVVFRRGTACFAYRAGRSRWGGR